MKARAVTALIGAALFAAVSVRLPVLARADGGAISSLDTVYFEIGYVEAYDAVRFGDEGLSGQGLRYYERHCCLGRLLAGVTFGLLLGAAAASPYKSIETKTTETPDYIITETTYTYYTEEEKRQNREAAAQATANILSFPFTMELIYFPEKDDGTLHGFQWTWYLVEWPKRSPVRLELGFHWDRLQGEIIDPMAPGGRREMTYKNIGMPFRLVARAPRFDFLQVDLEWRWNWYSQDDVPADENHNQMLRGSMTVQIPGELPVLQVFYGRATLQTNDIGDLGGVGYMLELGGRL